MRILVTGAGGFIGGYLCKRLIKDGHEVHGVDIKQYRAWWQDFGKVWHNVDLREYEHAVKIMEEVRPDRVYALAADMGGMGFISYNDAQILRNNLLININTLATAHVYADMPRYLFTSSVCVYPNSLLMNDDVVPPLHEEDAYPADPSDAYGWEKLTAEKLVQAYAKDHGMDTRIVRFQNTYGPYGSWTGGREKAPAALCRKIAESKLRGDDPISIDVWGDGQATRTFMYVDDCVEGLIRLMESDYTEPLNLGTEELVTVDELAMNCHVAAFDDPTQHKLHIRHVDGPQGHRNRGQDNSRIKEVLGWAPSISLQQGLAQTYPWIEKQVAKSMQNPKPHE